MKNTMKIGVKGFFLGCLLSVSFFSRAQNESDLSSFLKASSHDANVLIGGYTGPIIRGASYAMTGGWYTTAKTHKKLGVDLGVSLTAAFTPSSDNYFSPQSQLVSTTFANTTNPGAGAPSIVGPKDQTTYTSTYQGQSVTFNGPEGLALKKNIGFSAVPVPMIQIGIGLIKNTDLKVRFIPTINRASSKINMLGFGLLHDIKQYLPGGSLLPFDLSVLAAYNSVWGSTSLANTTDSNKPMSSNGQISYRLNSWVAQAIISKKISVLTAYVGVGYGAVSSKVDITGTFNFDSNPPFPQNFSITNPFSTTFKNNTTKLTGGIRLKFGPIYLVGDYTLQKYNALTVGLGLSIR